MALAPATVETRELILNAAERLFAAQGYAATTTKQIGGDAGVNAALLYYYFPDKHALYHAVLRRVFDGIQAEVGAGLVRGASPAEGIRLFVQGQLRMLARRPNAPKLLVREMIDNEAAHARGDITRLAAGTFRALCELIRKGQKRGEFRREVEPEFAAISTIAQIAYLFIARPAVGILLGEERGGLSASTVERFGDHAATFALAALRAPDLPAPFQSEVR